MAADPMHCLAGRPAEAVAGGEWVIELDVGRERGECERKGVKGVATYNRAGVAFLCTWMFTS